MNSQVKKNSVNWFIIAVIIISSYIPIVGSQLYFRHDDSQTLLWAHEFSDNIFYAFNPKPWLNEYEQYPGVGGYYRPFESIFVMILLKIFGPEAGIFQIINGLMVIGTIIFMFKIAELFSNKVAALVTVLVFHLCFHNILYGNFHVVVPFGYFFELGCFYFVGRGLVKNEHKYLLLSILFLIPATNRQTTAVILPLIIVVYLMSFWRETFANSKAKFAIPAVAMIPNLMIPFSGNASSSTILNLDANLTGKLNFLFERVLFYGSLLTSGVTGFVILFILLSFAVGHFVDFERFAERQLGKQRVIIIVALSGLGGLLVTLLMKSLLLAIFVLVSLLLFSLIVNKKFRYAGTWFFVSVGCFLAISYYHGAYLLEAAYGLSIVLGIMLYSVFQKLFPLESSRRFFQSNAKRVVIAGILGVVSLGVLGLSSIQIPVFSKKLVAIKALIQTNQNFKDLLNYISEEIPANKEIYTLSNTDLGMDDQTWRFWTMKERAEKVKIMNIPDTDAMLKVLGRYDLTLRSVNEINLSGQVKSSYFIASSKFEKNFAEKRFDLELIKNFRRGDTEAALYKFN